MTPRATDTPPADADAAAAVPPTPGTVAPAAPALAHPALRADIVFATFYCAPGVAPEDYQSRRPDLRFGAAIRAAPPGKKVHVAVLTDAETVVLDDGEADAAVSAAAAGDVEVFRCPLIERARVGRNSYANWAQMMAQGAYLGHLESLFAGSGAAPHPPVVFCDTDVLVVDDLSEVFESAEGAAATTPPLTPPPAVLPSITTPYDYGLTLSDSIDMPINFGVQFVPRGGAPRARAFLEQVCSPAVYDFSRTFVAGQEAIAEFTGVMDKPEVNVAVRRAAYGPAGRCVVGCGGGGAHLPSASFRVAFFPCLKYNYCRCGQSCCTDPGRVDGEAGDHAHAPASAAGFAAAGVKCFHAVGHRKPGFDVALAAFLKGGRAAAYAAIAALPDEESSYVDVFGADAVASGRAAAVEAAVEAALVAAGAKAAPMATPALAQAAVTAAQAQAALTAARAAADTATKAAEQAASAAAAATQAAAAVVAAAAGVVSDKKAAKPLTSSSSLDSTPPAPATAPVSRDPSPPRKKAAVAVAGEVGAR